MYSTEAILHNRLEQIFYALPGLNTAGPDLAGGQDESAGSGISQLGSERVLDFADVIGVVGGASRCHVDGAANGTGGIAGAVRNAKSFGKVRGNGDKFGAVRWKRAAAVPVG